MSSFKDTRSTLLLAYDEEIIDNEEFVLLYDQNTSKDPRFPYEEFEDFDLEAIDPVDCKGEFRVEKNDLPLLAESLRIPEHFWCQQGTVCRGMEGLCILLKRLSYPCRYSDMVPRFGKPVPVLNMITNVVIDYVYDQHQHLITEWNHTILNPNKLIQYAEAIARKGAALQNCFGFIDGTVRPLCRPGRNQRLVYNGHKRTHAIKFQSVTLPSGMIAQMYGPVEGKRHDAGILAYSGLLNQLQQHAYSPTGQSMCLYGDPAYPLRVHLQAPYRNAQITPQMQAFNTSMSAVRISFECLFGDITNYFKFMDYKKNHKLELNSVGKFYLVSAILRNALTCLYHNQTSKFFDIEPPTIQECFQ